MLQTTEVTKLQVGEDSKEVQLVCSTVSEIENLMPWLLECRRDKKDVNVSLPEHKSTPLRGLISERCCMGSRSCRQLFRA